jgi:formamidopyrimidine-DNA glycosylase
MPELPDLEYLKEYLSSRLIGVAVNDLRVMAPIVVRSADPSKFAESLRGRRFSDITRRGKYLLLHFDSDKLIVVSPMLSGRIHYRKLGDFDPKGKFYLSISLSNGMEIRYSDETSMGRIYLLENAGELKTVPKFDKLGIEALDPSMSPQKFTALLKHFDWEAKKVLTYQSFMAGIGNAYADEILFSARINPFRNCSTLSSEEGARLYASMREVLGDALTILRKRVGENIDVEVRDFMKIHGKGGQPCPVCGTRISEVKDMGRKTNFCRTCQPGSLFY